MADIKIPFKYCRIERAAQFLNCKIEDLLTLGIEDKITLNVMFDSVSSTLCMKGGVEESENWRKRLTHSYYCYGGALSISEYSSFKFDNLTVDSNDDPISRPYFNKTDDEYTFSCQGRAYGLWRLINNIDDLINYRIAYLGFLDFIPCLPPKGNQVTQIMLGAEISDDIDDELNEDDWEADMSDYRITDKDLWLTAFDIRRLLNCKGDYYLMEPLKNISPESNNEDKLQSAHPVINRHARNREQILIAAIKFKEQQPNVFRENCIKADNSINYTEFARQLLARPSFFPEGDCPLKTTEAIIKVLKKAYKSNVE